MRAVNLLPRDEQVRRRPKPSGSAIVVALLPVAVAGLVGGGFLMASGGVASKRETLAGLEQELAALPVPVPVDPASVALVQEKEKRITSLSGVLARRVAFDELLRELSLVLPDDVWLTNMTARSPQGVADGSGSTPATTTTPPSTPGQPAPAANGQPAAAATTDTAGFTVTGYTYSQEGVARLLARLAVIPPLANVRLERSALVPMAKRSVVQFTILADLRTGAAS